MNHWQIARSEFEDDFERLARTEADTETHIVRIKEWVASPTVDWEQVAKARAAVARRER